MIRAIKKFIDINYKRGMHEGDISYKESKKMLENGAILLDVRSIQEYNEEHLPNAMNLAYYDIPTKHNIILPDKTKDIIVYCQNGGRSKRALKSLKKLGYKNVYNLYGGLDNRN